MGSEMCIRDRLLTNTVDGSVATHGSLSHSHLNQVFRNIQARLPLAIDSLCDEEKKASAEKVFQHDKEFFQCLQIGILWEILSHRMEVEEPGAATLIQAALNTKNGIAMASHEMEVLQSVTKFCPASAAVAAQYVTFDKCWDHMTQLYALNIDKGDMLNMFNLVLELGGDNTPFLKLSLIHI